MSNQESPRFAFRPGKDQPEPAREALDEPHLSADELKKEIGDSEDWDEASKEKGSDLPEDAL